MSMKKQRRMSFSDLENFLRHCDADIRQFNGAQMDARRVMPAAIAHRIHMPVGTVHRYRRDGIPLYSADRIAAHLDVHPANIWPDFYEEEELCLT